MTNLVPVSLRSLFNQSIDDEEDDRADRGDENPAEVERFDLPETDEATEKTALLVARKAIEQYATTPFQKPLAVAFQKLSAGLNGKITFSWQELEHTFDFRPDRYSATESRSLRLLSIRSLNDGSGSGVTPWKSSRQ